MIEKEQWPPNNSPSLNTMEIPCLGSDARSYFETFIRSPKQFLEIKSRTGEGMGQFSTGPVTKALPRFRYRLTE